MNARYHNRQGLRHACHSGGTEGLADVLAGECSSGASMTQVR